jgi:hypothetical protein
MSAGFSLSSIAPRLARAPDAWLTEAAAIRAERRRLNELELHKERLVAHRDLQLCRSQAAGRMGSNRRLSWITRRDEKLGEAQRELAEVHAAHAALDERARGMGL